MSLFDDLMNSARDLKEKFNPPVTQNEGTFRKIGRMALGAFGIAPTASDSNLSEPEQEKIQQEDLPIDYVPPSPDRDIPEGAQIIGPEAAELYPPDSDIGKIIKNGYSIVSNPQDGSVIGFTDKYDNMYSPDEALSGAQVPQILQENGFYPTPENIARFVRQNDSINANGKDLDFKDLVPSDKKTILKSASESVMDSIKETPVFQVLAGIKNPLEIMANGFSRYEALKASIIKDAAINPIKAVMESAKAVSGTSETEFPNASLRSTPMVEMGDIFRKMGYPEAAAALGGLTLDALTDAVVLGGAGTAAKNIMKGIKVKTAAGLESNLFEEMYKKFNTFRSNSNVKMVENALVGKRANETKLAPEFIDKRRKIYGERNLARQNAGDAAGEIEKLLSSGTGIDLRESVPFEKLISGGAKTKDSYDYAVKAMSSENPLDELARLRLAEQSSKDELKAFKESPGFNRKDKAMSQKAMDLAYRSQPIREAAEMLESLIKNSPTGSVQASDLANYSKKLELTGLDTSSRRASLSTMINDVLNGTRDISMIPEAYRPAIRAARESIDKSSSDLANEINLVSERIPGLLEKESEEIFKRTGTKIPIEELPRTIVQNLGSYVTRSYRMFHKGWEKPSGELFDNAVKGLVDDLGISEKEAISKLDELASNKTMDFSFKNGRKLSVKQGSFIARQDIPDYLRKFMGEIDDPIFNIMNTQRNISDMVERLKTFRLMDDLGLASNEFVDGIHTVKVADDPLKWGAISGKYIPDDMKSLIMAKAASDDMMWDGLLKATRGLKFMKTVANIGGHIRQSMGNLGFFAGINGVSPFNPKNFGLYRETAQILMDAKKATSGGLKVGMKNFERISKNYSLYKKMIADGIIGPEMSYEDIGGWVEKMLKDPANTPAIKGGISDIINKVHSLGKKGVKLSSDAWAIEDQVVKVAAYLKHTKAGMEGSEAARLIYKTMPNYAEASELANYVRNNPLAMTVLSPFFTFRSEMHRILLNIVKEGTPQQRMWLAGWMGGRASANVAMLSYAGAGLKDIHEYFMSKPEAMSSALMNPAAIDSGEFDFNLRYLDPLNTGGLFAPLMKYSGATGVNPLDYFMDFTNFSPEFGYGNLVADAASPLLTGRGRFNEELSDIERLKEFAKGAGPSSLTYHLPNVITEKDPADKIRHAFRMFGLDFEKRDPAWIKSKVKSRLEQKIANGEDPTATLHAIDIMGFDSGKMLKQIQKKLERGKPIKKETKENPTAKLLSSYGF